MADSLVLELCSGNAREAHSAFIFGEAESAVDLCRCIDLTRHPVAGLELSLHPAVNRHRGVLAGEMNSALRPRNVRQQRAELAQFVLRTGKRVSRLNPEAEWMRKEVPELRIVPDDLWLAAKSRQKQTRHAVKAAGGLGAAKRPLYLFSGLTTCGICGAGFIMSGKNRLGCFGARDQGRCDNHLTIRRDEVEARVLQEKLLQQDLFEELCDEFTREMNRLRMEHRSSLSAAERENERIEVRRKKLVESIMDGVPAK